MEEPISVYIETGKFNAADIEHGAKLEARKLEETARVIIAHFGSPKAELEVIER